MNIQQLRALGFDLAAHVPFTKNYKVACSQCEALAINGHACHETGCPNSRHECAGCNEIIPLRQKYCADCA